MPPKRELAPAKWADVTYLRYEIDLKKYLEDMRQRVRYLVLHNVALKAYADELKVTVPKEEFNKFVSEQVRAYITDSKMPVKEVAPAILNIADDIMAGREPVIKSGDYIMIQSYLRSN